MESLTVNISRMDLIWSSIWTMEERCHVDVPPDKRLDNGVPKWHHNNITTRERERERERERKRLWGFNRPCMTTLTVFDPAPLLLSFSPSLLLSFSPSLLLSFSLSFLVINRPAIGSCLLKAAALFDVVHWGRFYSRRCNPLTSLSLSLLFFSYFFCFFTVETINGLGGCSVLAPPRNAKNRFTTRRRRRRRRRLLRSSVSSPTQCDMFPANANETVYARVACKYSSDLLQTLG